MNLKAGKLFEIKGVLLVSLLFCSLYLNANNLVTVPRIYEYIDISNGLPQNTVRCIEKDNYGFIWLGTDYGLCRFDGYDFKYYKVSDSGTSLKDNRVVDILADTNGVIWIVTNSGIQLLNSITDSFVDVLDNDVVELFDKDIVQILQIGSSIWVATYNDGVYELDISKSVLGISIKNHYLLNEKDAVISSLIKGEDGDIYLGTSKDVYIFNKEKKAFEFIEQDPYINFDVQVLYQKGKTLWIGTSNGLFKYTINNKTIEWYGYDAVAENTLPHSHITSIIMDAKGNLLVGTLGGLCVYNSENNNFNEISLFPSLDGKLHDVFVSELLTDNNGNVWVCTEKTGVVHYNVFSKKFYSFNEESACKPLCYNIINSIYASDEKLYVGTAGDGLYGYNIKSGKIKHFQLEQGKSNSLYSNFIAAVIEDSKGSLWVGTWGMGVQKIVANNGKETFTSYDKEKGLPDTFISCFYITSKGELIVGTRGGLAVFDDEKKVFVPVDISFMNPDAKWEVGCMIEDKDEYLWVGTTNGLHRFKADLISPRRNEKLSPYDVITFKKTYQEKSLPNDYITSLEKDSKGNIWIGTYGNGIAKCNAQSDGTFEFINYTEKDGLANNVVYQLLSDSKNDLWISTENGLSHYNIDDALFINYYKKDGLRNNQYYWSAGYKAPSGKLYFGGLNGLNFFDPDSIISYPIGSKTYITKLTAGNKVINPGEKRHGKVSLNKAIFSTDTIHLSYKDNVFSFEFSALPYYLSTKIKYEYQLEGVDQYWVEVGSDRRMASYTNLSGGNYLFKVRSTNIDGVWNEDYSSILLIIDPPYWKTSWFKIILLLALVLLVSAYIRYRSFRITEQKRRLEKIVEDRTDEIKIKNEQLEQNSKALMARNQQLAQRQDEIEKQKDLLEQQNREIISQRDQLIALNEEVESIHQKRMQFFTNISHEFRTPLTLIISPIEKILNDNFVLSKDNVKHTVSYIKRNAERLLMLTNEILTFRKFEAGKVSVSLIQGNLTELIQGIADAFRTLTEKKNITFNTAVDFNLENVWYDKSKLENILFNLLSNAIKYTPEKGQISFTATKIFNSPNKPNVLINIQDNGIGISKSAQAKVFDRFYRDDSDQGNSSYGTGIGLALTKQMVEVLNGKITLESELNKGSSFKVILPLEKEDFPTHDVKTKEVEEQISLQEKVLLMSDLDVVSSNHIQNENEISDELKKLLIVEDNTDLREFLAEALSVNFKVTVAENGERGYELACENDFDLIVSDIMMPKVNGLEMCKMLKNNIQTSHIPIILLTAKNQEEDYIEGLQYGADDYISKPFNLNVLQAKINSIIDNREKLIQRYQKVEEDTEEPEVSSLSALDEEFMNKVNQIIEEFYTDSTFDIDAFSSKLYVSRSLLYKKLKALTDVSPNEYITIYRLKKSITLLKSKKHQVSEVAFMVGFNDPKYFSRVFKKYHNCSPSSYLE